MLPSVCFQVVAPAPDGLRPSAAVRSLSSAAAGQGSGRSLSLGRGSVPLCESLCLAERPPCACCSPQPPAPPPASLLLPPKRPHPQGGRCPLREFSPLSRAAGPPPGSFPKIKNRRAPTPVFCVFNPRPASRQLSPAGRAYTNSPLQRCQAATGSGAAVMGRPTTMKSLPSSLA